jgi:hypothetical protein
MNQRSIYVPPEIGVPDNLWMVENTSSALTSKNILVVAFDIWHRIQSSKIRQVPGRGNSGKSIHSVRALWKTQIHVGDFHRPLFTPVLAEQIPGTIIRGIFEGSAKPFVSKLEMTQEGFVPAYEAKPEVVLGGEQQQIEFTQENKFSVSYLNDESIRKLSSLAEENQINLYLANAPVFEDLNSNPDYQAYFQDLQAYLEDLAEERSKVKHISSVKPSG